MIKKIVRKPVEVIEAIRLLNNDDSIEECIEWVFKIGMETSLIGKSATIDDVKNKGGFYIPTLEGNMKVSMGDYIIKDVNGEFYPCKPDIFDKTYEEVSNDMDFSLAIKALKKGKAIRRTSWSGKGMFVVKQVPSHIESDIIPKMQSLPQSAKSILMNRENPHIDYTNQMLIINPDGRADSWVPSSSDVFAEDWEVVTE